VLEGPGGSAAFFDLDKTVIATSSALAFGRPFYRGGLINRRTLLRGVYAQLVFRSQGADEGQMDRLRAYLQTLVTGWDVEEVRRIVQEALAEMITPRIYAEALDLMAEHRAAGRDVVIVSSSGEDVVGPISELLGVDEVVATRMEVSDGRYTGRIEYYAYAEGKAAAIRELAAARGYDLAGCYAYSDSITDLPMLELVGHPVAVNPDRALRRVATERGWPVVAFAQPVTLWSRWPQLRPQPASLVAAGAVAAGAVGVAIWTARRKS
jgi:HAD superfamily hydrolase (TIGR01490 family)